MPLATMTSRNQRLFRESLLQNDQSENHSAASKSNRNKKRGSEGGGRRKREAVLLPPVSISLEKSYMYKDTYS